MAVRLRKGAATLNAKPQSEPRRRDVQCKGAKNAEGAEVLDADQRDREYLSFSLFPTLYLPRLWENSAADFR